MNEVEYTSLTAHSQDMTTAMDLSKEVDHPLKDDKAKQPLTSPVSLQLHGLNENTNNFVPTTITNNTSPSVDEAEHAMVGGWPGHLFRRVWHIGLFISIPILYYYGTVWFFDSQFKWPSRIASTVAMSYVLIETARLTIGFTCFGMRKYESNQISGNAWGVFSLALLFLVAPMQYGKQPGSIGIPIAWSLALADPIMGEIRRAQLPLSVCIIAGLVIVAAMWIICIFWLGTPWFLSFFMIPLTVMSELPKIPSIDDNAVMLLLPLAFVMLIQPWL